MSVFNSLGSNYTFSFAIRSLFSIGSRDAPARLTAYLEKRYGGKAYLSYKGREAIELALDIIGDQSNQVAINGFTCYAVYKAIKNCGYQPYYLDINPDSLDYSLDTLQKAVASNPSIKIVIIQNTLGYPVAGREIANFCTLHNLVLIEDLAHSIGATYESDEEVGTLGDFVTLSFSQDKMIDGISGGALIVRNPNFFDRVVTAGKPITVSRHSKDRFYPLLTILIRKTYDVGIGKALHLVCKRFNLLPRPVDSNLNANRHQLPSWYCGLILNQFNVLSDNLAHRRMIANIYIAGLNKSVLTIPLDTIERASNLRFPILVPRRDGLIKHLQHSNVHVSDIWYDAPIAPRKYLHLTDYNNQCPNSEDISLRMLNLPTHLNVSSVQAKRIIEKINGWLSNNA